MSAPEFKELVRRTFHLKLTGTEVGALFDFFNNSDAPEVRAISSTHLIVCLYYFCANRNNIDFLSCAFLSD